mmetsp:Transcript_118373/g.334525  ORF Transcript_118373/g.334525 Transcript_118373/m.334525 type:complete len:253 (+) Transcript_118373:122-880(+)
MILLLLLLLVLRKTLRQVGQPVGDEIDELGSYEDRQQDRHAAYADARVVSEYSLHVGQPHPVEGLLLANVTDFDQPLVHVHDKHVPQDDVEAERHEGRLLIACVPPVQGAHVARRWQHVRIESEENHSELAGVKDECDRKCQEALDLPPLFGSPKAAQPPVHRWHEDGRPGQPNEIVRRGFHDEIVKVVEVENHRTQIPHRDVQVCNEGNDEAVEDRVLRGLACQDDAHTVHRRLVSDAHLEEHRDDREGSQ